MASSESKPTSVLDNDVSIAWRFLEIDRIAATEKPITSPTAREWSHALTELDRVVQRRRDIEWKPRLGYYHAMRRAAEDLINGL